MAGVTLTFDSQSSHADIQALAVAYAPMQPVNQTEPTLPKPRPDPALAYDLQPIDITLPRRKPALKDILLETNITFQKDGIRIINMDKSHTILAHLHLNAENFEKEATA